METPLSEQMMKIMRMILSASWRMNWRWRSTWSRSCRMRHTRWEKELLIHSHKCETVRCWSCPEPSYPSWALGCDRFLVTKADTFQKLFLFSSTAMHASGFSACAGRPHCLRHVTVVLNITRAIRWARIAPELVLCQLPPSHLDLSAPYHIGWFMMLSWELAIFRFCFPPVMENIHNGSSLWTEAQIQSVCHCHCQNL